MLPLFDSHVHLNLAKVADEQYRQIRVIIPGVNGEDTRILQPKWPLALFASGLHPLWLNDSSDFKIDLLANMVATGGFCAIGECGFDKRAKLTLKQQQHYFMQQVNIASELNLPLIIHLVGGLEHLLECYKQTPFKGVIHSYNLAQIPKLLHESEIYFGFSSRLPTNSRANKLFSTLPLERILIESDADNHYPANITNLLKTAERLAILRQENEMHIAQTTYNNAIKLFANK